MIFDCYVGSNSIAHFNAGVYDVGFNSPPDFTGPMSNRSDMSETDKRLAVLQRQQSGIASPSQGMPSIISYLPTIAPHIASLRIAISV